MVSHDNVTFNAYMITKFLSLVDGKEVLVSYLPLSHVAAQVRSCTIDYDSFFIIFNIYRSLIYIVRSL